MFTPAPELEKLALPGGTSIAFRGAVAGHPLFSQVSGRPTGQWAVRLPYGLDETRKPGSVPVWLVPSLVPASDKRTLELDLHWVALDEGRPGEKRRELALDRFELIELVVPTSWGNVERADPPAFIGNPESAAVRTIQWKQLPPGRQPGSQTLTVRFEKQINLHDKLTGSLQALFRGTLSGITDVAMYRPTGAGWLQPPKSNVKMEASVDFELSLSSVRYQDVRVVPNDQKKDEDRRDTDNFSGVIPDHVTVVELTNGLSESGYYVKRVIENQPRRGARADMVNRYWDIAGRRYDGVFPIDFHVTLTGEEEHRGGIRASAGNTEVRLTVQGSYVDQKMEAQVEDEWDQLHEIVDAKLRDQAAATPAETAAPSGAPYTPPPRQPADSLNGDRATILRERLDAATDKLLSGAISEDTYRRIEAQIRAELDGTPGRD